MSPFSRVFLGVLNSTIVIGILSKTDQSSVKFIVTEASKIVTIQLINYSIAIVVTAVVVNHCGQV